MLTRFLGKGGSREGWTNRAILVNLILGCGFVVSFIFFAWRARFPVPYMDDWNWLASFQAPDSFTGSLWRLHNEHLIVIPRLLVWLDFWLWGWGGYVTLVAGLLSHVAVAGVLIDSTFRRHDRPTALLALPTLALAAFPAQIIVGLVWAAKADHLRTASLTLASGVSDDEWIRRLHVLGISEIRPSLGALSARGAPFLQFSGRGEISPNVGALAILCHGDLEASDPNLAGQQSSGLRIAGGLRERGDVLLVTDARGGIRGLAREAPLVSYGHAYANDFVWAVLTNLVRPPDRTRQLRLGFSDRGSGPPYTAELLEPDGRLVCKKPIACCSAPPTAVHPPLIVGPTLSTDESGFL